jgi:hypothetical protein
MHMQQPTRRMNTHKWPCGLTVVHESFFMISTQATY